MELGYHHWRVGRRSEARGAFERAWRADQRNVAVAEQLVYVHQGLKDNQQARWYAERVLDKLDTLDPPDPSSTTTATAATLADRRFGLKRLHEDLGRRLTVSLDAWSGPRVGTGTSASQAGTSSSSYSQLEVDFRLGKQTVRDGKTLSAYARIMGDGGERRSTLPSQNALLGMGLRWKPLRNHVFYLAGEHQNSLEDGTRRDFLLRASASFLNGGRYGDDWHESGPGWFAHNLYIDAAHYVDADRSAFTADYRAGYHGKAASNQSMEPYAHIQVNGVNAASFERDIRGGGGVRWNIWYGASRYDAARHKLSLGVEFQRAFDTSLSDRRGVFFTLGTHW
jgi:bacteriophage N4 adsorption protein A